MNFKSLTSRIFLRNQDNSFEPRRSLRFSFNEVAGGANDIIVIEKGYYQYASTPLNIVIGKLSNTKTFFNSRRKTGGKLLINGNHVLSQAQIEIGTAGVVSIKRGRKSSFCFTTEEIQLMQLNKGINRAVFNVEELNISITFYIYLLSHDKKFIVSDIDGTITRSDVIGFLGGSLGFDVHHLDVIRFLQNVHQNGYHVIYVSARPMAFDQNTREYLFDTLQNDVGGNSLPLGAVFLNPLPTTPIRLSDPCIMKTKVLNTFLDMFQNRNEVIVGAYGNTVTDTTAYLNAGIPPDKIFLLDKESQIVNYGTKKKYSYTDLANTVSRIYPKQVTSLSI